MTLDTYGLRARPKSPPRVKAKRSRSQKTINTADSMYAWIEKFQKKHGYSPTRREIGKQFSCSTSVATYYLLILVERGKMKPLDFGLSRAIVLIPQKEPANEQPTA